MFLFPHEENISWKPGFKPKVTVRQFSGYRKFKSIYAETMLLFKVIGGMATMWNRYARKRYAVVRIGNQNYLALR